MGLCPPGGDGEELGEHSQVRWSARGLRLGGKRADGATEWPSAAGTGVVMPCVGLGGCTRDLRDFVRGQVGGQISQSEASARFGRGGGARDLCG